MNDISISRSYEFMEDDRITNIRKEGFMIKYYLKGEKNTKLIEDSSEI